MVDDAFDVDASTYDGIDVEGIAQEELDRAGVNTVTAWQDNMLEADYRATGDTVNSITMESPEDFVRLIGSDRIAALIGEKGRAPGKMPPHVDIADWVHEKPGLPNRGETVEWDFGDGPTPVTFDQVVFLIRRAIAENGLPAYHFGERAFREEAPKFEERLVERLNAAIDEQAE